MLMAQKGGVFLLAVSFGFIFILFALGLMAGVIWSFFSR